MSPGSRAESFGAALCAAVFLTGLLSALNVFGATANHSIVVGNATPVVSAVTLNHGSPIILTPNATTTVDVNFTVSDNNGCTDVFSSGTISVLVYRSGVGSSSASTTSSTFNAYWGTVISTSSCSGVAGNATATVNIWYYADATDASSSYASQDWKATAKARDGSNALGTGDSAGVELNTMLAIGIFATSTIDYGTITPGTNTGSTTVQTTLENQGNSAMTLEVSGTALTSGSNVIATSSQHYASSTFTYGGPERVLSSVSTAVDGIFIPIPPNELNSWTMNTALPIERQWHAAATYNNFWYVVAGNAGGATSSVLFSSVNTSTGVLSSWQNATALPTDRDFLGAVAYNGYLYAIGGRYQSGTANTSSVIFAPINATGSIGAWSNTTGLPVALGHVSAVATSGYLYVIGGTGPGTGVGNTTATVSFAPINATGSIGAWSQTAALPGARADVVAFEHNGYLYSIGGNDTASSPTNATYHARINATGSLSTWQTNTSLPYNLDDSVGGVDATGRVIIAGGWSGGSNSTSTVLMSSLSAATATLDAWIQDRPLPNNLQHHEGGYGSGYFFVIGGTDGSTVSSTYSTRVGVSSLYWGASVSSTVAKGSYSGTVTFTAVFSP